MDGIKKYLERPRIKNKTTERGSLLEYFVTTVNSGRKGTKYKPVTIKRIAFMLTGVKTSDLYALKSKMEDGERRGTPGSAIFFLETKAEKV